jgi:hypothetical protein
MSAFNDICSQTVLSVFSIYISVTMEKTGQHKITYTNICVVRMTKGNKAS